MGLETFLSKEAQKQVVDAIENAERLTSGEIRVHIEPKCKIASPYERAVEVFYLLKMNETKEHNGVLIYIAYNSHKFAIVGDSGINDVVPSDFWDIEKEALAKYLAEGNAAAGLCEVIEIIGKNLSKYFPCKSDDINEQSNEISFEED